MASSYKEGSDSRSYAASIWLETKTLALVRCRATFRPGRRANASLLAQQFRLTDLLALFLSGQPLKMHASSLRNPLALFPSAVSTTTCPGVDVTLGNFIPPLLLRRGPHFLLAATDAVEWLVFVETVPDELRLTVTVVRRKQRGIARSCLA